jgi:hypothetical protein
MIVKRGRALDRWVEILLSFGAGGGGRAQPLVVSRVEFSAGNLILVFKGIEALLHVEFWVSSNEGWERG